MNLNPLQSGWQGRCVAQQGCLVQDLHGPGYQALWILPQTRLNLPQPSNLVG